MVTFNNFLHDRQANARSAVLWIAVQPRENIENSVGEPLLESDAIV